ncbi:hypothetical protein FNU76_03620 [Chitinimonas arctica]|uniref:Uncharacterized protein n=1 Tax=Chitinimonas arctica TaxID=2594795 RepID=A0A516SBJ3_9NEIS|nr:hypothetical protein [Chitinimonas arctica]QDQ25516.1 hypothetical protein FNU76_03620 [Chitinimonas arctica]
MKNTINTSSGRFYPSGNTAANASDRLLQPISGSPAYSRGLSGNHQAQAPSNDSDEAKLARRIFLGSVIAGASCPIALGAGLVAASFAVPWPLACKIIFSLGLGGAVCALPVTISTALATYKNMQVGTSLV